ncbi:DUF1330 domain-containing protein [Chitinibacter fontanus]|uniref:DUF1330 domain-containing protein n=1 Tax=Chitinibacter fontanus TaxID=1737446 RepID=A0A7D5ZFA5_9NEIS|nr:DUF1330 domain-containing protein [Chitinibacter fontanus]QLI82024.1 DUF1330 domain-containing protein [Chitinibacter fontanus]
MSKVYCIVNILKINDSARFAEYVAGHAASIAQYGGRFLVKGDAGEVLEGTLASNLMVVHEFPSEAQFRAWYDSPEYRPWKALRQSCAEVTVILSRGCAD